MADLNKMISDINRVISTLNMSRFLALLTCLINSTISAIIEPFLQWVFNKNRLFKWTKLVCLVTWEVVSTLVHAGVTLCVCSYLIFIECDREDGKVKCPFEEDICEVIRTSDMRRLLARCACAPQCRTGYSRMCDGKSFGKMLDKRFLSGNECGFGVGFDICNPELSGVGFGDMYCFDKFPPSRDFGNPNFGNSF